MATLTEHGRHRSNLSFSHLDLIHSSLPFDMDDDPNNSPSIPMFPDISEMPNANGPLPNPPFVFPARNGVSSAPSTISRATGRRPLSSLDRNGPTSLEDGQESRRKRSLPPPLPSFSFNVKSLQPDSASPTLSADHLAESRQIPSRAAGHRRGGSEFIGGDGVTGTGDLLSTSPLKSAAVLPGPGSSLSLAPSTGRRGHAHRRSAAISCHDLSAILKPPPSTTSPIGGSAPTSPCNPEFEHSALGPSSDAFFPASEITSPADEISSTLTSESVMSRAARTARVGFSDTLEFIPRPLSLASNETSSTITAARGHSLSGSVSSLVSAAAVSPPYRDQEVTSSPSSNPQKEKTRPSTAESMLGDVSNPQQSNIGLPDPLSDNWDLSALNDSGDVSDNPSTPRSSGRKNCYFSQVVNSNCASPSTSRPVSSNGSEKLRSESSHEHPVTRKTLSSDVPVLSVEVTPSPSRRTSLTRIPSKKQKKVRSWAGSILSGKSRRSRSQKQKSLNRRSPTPPLHSYDAYVHGQFPVEEVDKTIEQEAARLRFQPSFEHPSFANWKPRPVITQEDLSTPMIDLDAALGPFNTPSGHDPLWEAAQRSGNRKRPMHSAAGMRNFVGPGMHYHRRAESAPEMAPFENPRFRLHHIGSNSSMEDVFEEDEEEDWEEVKTLSHKTSLNKVDEHDVSEEETTADLGTPVSDYPNRITNPGRRDDTASLGPGRIAEDKNVLLDVTEHSFVARPISSSKSSFSTPTPPLRPLPATKETGYADLHTLHPQASQLATAAQSFSPAFPSPRSPIFYDLPRLPTAHSSINDEHSPTSLWHFELGHEIRMSDDVPSLTSSTSTMTKESAMNPAFGNPQFRSGQRSSSLSGPSVTRKRASIASLSRLLTSSYGEKSKLSIEDRPPRSPDKKEKKTRRLSRLMHFWRKDENLSDLGK